MSKKVKAKKEAPKKEQAPAEESKGLPLHGTMSYLIVIGDDVDVRYEQSNENNLVSFVAVQNVYEDLWKTQKEPGTPDRKMDKDELKELQISMNFIKKHIALLGNYVQNKYKNAIPDKPIIETVSPLAAMKEIDKHKSKK